MGESLACLLSGPPDDYLDVLVGGGGGGGGGGYLDALPFIGQSRRQCPPRLQPLHRCSYLQGFNVHAPLLKRRHISWVPGVVGLVYGLDRLPPRAG